MNDRSPARWPDHVSEASDRRSSAVSKRQIFGRQAKRNSTVVGARRIEIKRDMRIDRVSITKLPLQDSCRKQSPRAACRKEQRYCICAEIDGESAIAPRFGFCGDVRNVAPPGLPHRVDASRTHDQACRIDLDRSFRNLDLRALEISNFGAVIGGGPMPRDI